MNSNSPLGLAFVFEDMVEELIARKKLARVLEDWCPYYPGLFLYFPVRRQISFALKSFIEFAKAESMAKRRGG